MEPHRIESRWWRLAEVVAFSFALAIITIAGAACGTAASSNAAETAVVTGVPLTETFSIPPAGISLKEFIGHIERIAHVQIQCDGSTFDLDHRPIRILGPLAVDRDDPLAAFLRVLIARGYTLWREPEAPASTPFQLENLDGFGATSHVVRLPYVAAEALPLVGDDASGEVATTVTLKYVKREDVRAALSALLATMPERGICCVERGASNAIVIAGVPSDVRAVTTRVQAMDH